MTDEGLPPENPATRLLDACRQGDLDAALALLPAGSRLSLPSLGRAWQGEADVRQAYAQALALFPDLSYRPHTRHVGRGVVIDEGRAIGTQTGGANPTGRTLSLPVRVSVRHGATYTVEAAFPVALVHSALGLPVDRGALAAAQVYSVMVATTEEGLTTYALAEPEPVTPAAPISTPEPPTAAIPEPTRRRAPVWWGAAAAVALIIAGGAWLVGGTDDTTPSSSSTVSQSPTPSQKPSPTSSPTTPASTQTPSPSAHPTRKPNVTLKSDLAFGYDSATLSQAARNAISRVARQARAAGLEGDIFVGGYTDNLGSAAHGRTLSQQRADAVATVLRNLLSGHPLRVIAVGHGEADPIASNATEPGRQQNRRVTITLPQP